MRTIRWLSLPALTLLFLQVAVAQTDPGNSTGKRAETEVAGPPGSGHAVKESIAQAPVVGVVSAQTAGGANASSSQPESSLSRSESGPLGTKLGSKTNDRDSVPGARATDSPAPDKTIVANTGLPLPDDYVIGEEDVLNITVWKERDLSNAVVVRPDGIITVPLVGEMKVAGMTPIQLQAALTERLKPFVTVPQVSVAVNQITSRKVYLIGQAAKEGTFSLNSSTTVLQLIAQAGGLRDYAKRKKIYILRKRGGEQVRYSFNYDDVIRGRKMEQNILLAPGDTVVVP